MIYYERFSKGTFFHILRKKVFCRCLSLHLSQKFSLFFCLLCFGNVYSQNTVSGKIVDENEKALEKSHIHISSKTTNSKKDGSYSIRNIPNGSTKVLITYVGYKPIDTIIEISGNLELNFKMILINGNSMRLFQFMAYSKYL